MTWLTEELCGEIRIARKDCCKISLSEIAKKENTNEDVDAFANAFWCCQASISAHWRNSCDFLTLLLCCQDDDDNKSLTLEGDFPPLCIYFASRFCKACLGKRGLAKTAQFYRQARQTNFSHLADKWFFVASPNCKKATPDNQGRTEETSQPRLTIK